MRLRKGQKEALLRWIAEGLRSDEINDLAAEFIPPFKTYTRQVAYYRKSRDADIQALIAAGEQDALSEGLAVRAERVKKLKQLGALMERDLFGGFLWVEDIKIVGSGDSAEVVDFEKFNAAEVKEYRSTLDDIAKEMGHRANKQEISGPKGGPVEVETSGGLTERALEILAEFTSSHS